MAILHRPKILSTLYFLGCRGYRLEQLPPPTAGTLGILGGCTGPSIVELYTEKQSSDVVASGSPY